MLAIILSIIALAVAASNYNRIRDLRDAIEKLKDKIEKMHNSSEEWDVKRSQQIDSLKDKLANLAEKVTPPKRKPGRPKVKK